MKGIEKERDQAIAHEAKTIRESWLREREEARAVQISANAEVRNGWKESDKQERPILEEVPVMFQK